MTAAGQTNATVRRVRAWAGLLLVCLVVIVARVVAGSYTEKQRADAAKARGDLAAAAVHYRRAASWYVPFSPISSAALGELERIGEKAKSEGDYVLALLAFRSLRGGILSARSFYTPHQDLLDRSEHTIAYLMSVQDPPPVDVGKPPEQVAEEHYALLAEHPRPQLGLAMLALSGCAVWMWALFSLARSLEDAHGRIRFRALRKYGLMFVIGVAAFFFGLRFA